MDKMLGGPQSRPGRRGAKKILDPAKDLSAPLRTLVYAPMWPVLMGSSFYCVVNNTTVSSTILETPEDGQCWSKHLRAYTSDVEEILKFET
jgi:hypothetical protein